VITSLLLVPRRVVNINIWFGELFCISSAMMKLFLNVLPRINAKGEISMMLFFSIMVSSCC